MLWLRSRRPLAALGIALFLGCQLLTGTILPLELIYEHRNYFASFGLLLAIVPLLAVPRSQPFALPRHVLLAGLLLCWTALTAITAYAWGNPLRLAEDLASRAPQSPRAQYELGRTYIIYSHYDPASPFTRLAYAPLEKAAATARLLDPAGAGADLHECAHAPAAEGCLVGQHDCQAQGTQTRRAGRKLAGCTDPMRTRRSLRPATASA